MWLDNTGKGEFELPIGAIVRFSDTGQIQLLDDDGQEHWVSSRNAGQIKVMHSSSIEGVQDMVRTTAVCLGIVIACNLFPVLHIVLLWCHPWIQLIAIVQ